MGSLEEAIEARMFCINRARSIAVTRYRQGSRLVRVALHIDEPTGLALTINEIRPIVALDFFWLVTQQLVRGRRSEDDLPSAPTSTGSRLWRRVVRDQTPHGSTDEFLHQELWPAFTFHKLKCEQYSQSRLWIDLVLIGKRLASNVSGSGTPGIKLDPPPIL